jgi:hypothetical protein
VRTEDLTFVMLVGLPLVAAISLGLLARAFVYGDRYWLAWLALLVVSCAVWRSYLGAPL